MLAEALDHAWTDATCTAPKTCTACSKTEGVALGHEYAEGKCTGCGETDPDYVAPHEHNFVEGECECGETDPDYDDPTDNEELTFVEKIMQIIKEFLAKLTDLFNNLFAGLKE